MEPWLLRVADEVQRFADAPGRTKNNHDYWAGLAVGAVGAATGSSPHWEFARRVVSGRVFALEPLAKLAEIAAARGEDWHAAHGGALDRLAALTRRGL